MNTTQIFSKRIKVIWICALLLGAWASCEENSSSLPKSDTRVVRDTHTLPTGQDSQTISGDVTLLDQATADILLQPDLAITKDGSVVKQDGAILDQAIKDQAVKDLSQPKDVSLGDAGCTIGEARSLATPDQLDLFGTPAYFNNDTPLPPGRYRIRYVDGCMKYGNGQGWTVNAYAKDRSCWYVIGENSNDRIVVPPGNIGYTMGDGGYETFEDCVTASLATTPIEFEITTSKRLGIWLLDSPYSDNQAGQDGRNPRWALESITNCGATDQ